MDAFVTRKRRRSTSANPTSLPANPAQDDESTDYKLAVLASLHPRAEPVVLLEALLACDGAVDGAAALLSQDSGAPRRKRTSGGYQASLTAFDMGAKPGAGEPGEQKLLTKKGRVLHLFAPEDVAAHTPCTIVHNFLPAAQANALLEELLPHTPSFMRGEFVLFDRVVKSAHSMGFYVHTLEEIKKMKADYNYNGNRVSDVREILPEMRKVSAIVEATVNTEVKKRIATVYGGKKLQYQSPHEWKPNAAFVNCYDGPGENVGYHSDTLTYLGPRAIIGSLSLGVEREFRVRKIMARDDGTEDDERADAQGQIAIHLPHNSLLVMHAEMQEEWKHSIAPAQTIVPHPLAGQKRLNITYRHYRDSLNPRLTPRCSCGVPTVLRCVKRTAGNRGRYMWMCYAGYSPGKKGCTYFEWAGFDDDGDPIWKHVVKPQESDEDLKAEEPLDNGKPLKIEGSLKDEKPLEDQKPLKDEKPLEDQKPEVPSRSLAVSRGTTDD
ncbi:GRF zinc finger domain-containing protein [Trichodelitschia bisporula]|uniref:GRF zinc finger domain-containing protein n=1 Tax=Trichodelitschia bisporula TaxID=703511 RepID=A0A6G1I2L4_9PEZI|nr:GRF zinc finger domain-containing protein [Trichodelitschia bisporula]